MKIFIMVVFVQSFALCKGRGLVLGTQLPFCLDVCQETFEQLDLLLKIVCHNLKGTSYPPPRQEDECMAIATLNLLRLQFRAAINEEVDPASLSLLSGSHLLTSLKQCIVQLACNEGVLESVQRAAQSVLQDGWVILMPTVTERAEALSSLLPSSEGTKTVDLPVGSLLKNGPILNLSKESGMSLKSSLNKEPS